MMRIAQCCLIVVLLGADKPPEPRFRNVEIEADFEPYLTSNRLLMEVTGAKVIRRKDGTSVVISVGSTVLKDSSAKERLRAEKICRVKALASVVAEKQGIQVAHTEMVKEETVIVLDEAKERATSVMEVLQVTKTKVEGMTRDMPVIGQWRSTDGETYYLAIGAIFDRNGKPLPIREK